MRETEVVPRSLRFVLIQDEAFLFVRMEEE